MSRHDPYVTLRQMRDHAREAMELSAGRSLQDLEENRILQLALIHLVEVIGEAATRLPQTFRDSHPGIPWHAIIGTRNRLIHGYDKVDLETVWTVIEDNLTSLVKDLDQILNNAGYNT